MTKHTFLVAKSLEEKGLIKISLAITGIGLNKSRRWANEMGIKNFNLQGRGCLGEKMKRQVLKNKKLCKREKIKNIIFIGTDLPNLCHMDFLHTVEELKHHDLILGPSSDGGYWLIAFSEKILSKYINLPFINIKWSRETVLKETIDSFSQINLKYKFLHTKTDIDTIIDIENK